MLCPYLERVDREEGLKTRATALTLHTDLALPGDMRLTFVVVVITLTAVQGFKVFQGRIPNGESVPHPCKPNYVWQGVGHKNSQGGLDRNQFGLDFFQSGKKWTVELCQKDSDGDGMTNGQELGDPNCVWSEGQAPEIIVGLSHPGVCEPYGSDKCKDKNTWVTCDTGEFKCDALNREDPADLRNVTLSFTKTEVPATETNYYCMTFDLPQDEEYHMIASQPVIDNAYVMHHMILFGCEDTAPDMTTPGPCGMGLRSCFNIIGLWAVGFSGDCIHDQAGFAIGKGAKAYKKVALQMHWNNPLLKSGYMDASGMMIHLTKNKRTHDAGVFMTGQRFLRLPPGEERVEVEGRCTSAMTSTRLTGPIQITRAFNHMHYLGRQMRMEHYRDGVKLRDLSYDEVYSYDSPVVYDYLQSIEFRKGDEIRTTCAFKTTERSKTIFEGDATSDEMCYGFVTFHPRKNMPLSNCVSWKNIDLMDFYMKNEINNCRFKDFMDMNNNETKQLHEKVLSHCSHLGQCLKECIAVVKEVRRHPCLKGDIHDWLRDKARQDTNQLQLALFFSAMDSCNTEIALESCNTPPPTRDPTSPAPRVTPTLMGLVLAVLSLRLL